MQQHGVGPRLWHGPDKERGDFDPGFISGLKEILRDYSKV